jgi:hypothetical protein
MRKKKRKEKETQPGAMQMAILREREKKNPTHPRMGIYKCRIATALGFFFSIFLVSMTTVKQPTVNVIERSYTQRSTLFKKSRESGRRPTSERRKNFFWRLYRPKRFFFFSNFLFFFFLFPAFAIHFHKRGGNRFGMRSTGQTKPIRVYSLDEWRNSRAPAMQSNRPFGFLFSFFKLRRLLL